jgi:hypothetical protein
MKRKHQALVALMLMAVCLGAVGLLAFQEVCGLRSDGNRS